MKTRSSVHCLSVLLFLSAMNIAWISPQASAKIDALSDAQTQAQRDAEERWKRSDERWTRTEESIRSLLSIAEIHEREIGTLGEQIAQVSENGRATDKRLNALINTVERQISEGRNGKL